MCAASMAVALHLQLPLSSVVAHRTAMMLRRLSPNRTMWKNTPLRDARVVHHPHVVCLS